MAKAPKSSNDPAALAFSAVEDALKASAANAAEAKPARTSAAPARDTAAKKIARRAASPANDDRFTSSKLLTAMQARPSSSSIWLALITSFIWIAVVATIGWMRFGQSLTSPEASRNFFTSTDFLGLLALALFPVLAIAAIAALVRRSHDLRVAAVSMTQAAIRLTEPETDAADQVASVGQAVRREVNALGDGL